MRPSIYWLPLREAWRLAIMPRPRAGDWLDDEIAGWKAEGIDVVVSLLEPHEIEELELHRLPASCRAAEIEFVLVRNGYDVASAYKTIAKARSVEVPDTEVQRAWVSTFLAAPAG
jgi:hypothetical protein